MFKLRPSVQHVEAQGNESFLRGLVILVCRRSRGADAAHHLTAQEDRQATAYGHKARPMGQLGHPRVFDVLAPDMRSQTKADCRLRLVNGDFGRQEGHAVGTFKVLQMACAIM